MSCFCWRNTPYLKVKDILCSHRSGYAQLTRNAKYSQKEAILTLFFSKASEKLWSIYNGLAQFSSVQSLSYVRLFVTPMDCSMPGLPVHHQLLEFTQWTHVHWVGDAIQSSHPLSSSSPPAVNLSQHQCLFQWVSSSHQVPKGLEFQLQHQSFQWIFRTDFL